MSLDTEVGVGPGAFPDPSENASGGFRDEAVLPPVSTEEQILGRLGISLDVDLSQPHEVSPLRVASTVEPGRSHHHSPRNATHLLPAPNGSTSSGRGTSSARRPAKRGQSKTEEGESLVGQRIDELEQQLRDVNAAEQTAIDTAEAAHGEEVGKINRNHQDSLRHADEIEKNARIRAAAKLAAASTRTVDEVQTAESQGEGAVNQAKRSLRQHAELESDSGRLELPLRRHMAAFDAEEVLAIARRTKDELIETAESEGRIRLTEAKRLAEEIMREARARASNIRAQAAHEKQIAINDAHAELADAKEQIRTAAQRQRKTITHELATLESPGMSQRPAQSRSAPGRVRSSKNKWLTRGGAVMGLVGALAAVGVVLQRGNGPDGGSPQAGNSSAEQQLALKVAQLPDWNNMPLSIRAWQEEVTAVIQDSRIEVEDKDGKMVNHVLGNGTAAEPGHADILYALMAMDSQGEPTQSPNPLIAISQDDANRLIKEMKLTSADLNYKYDRNKPDEYDAVLEKGGKVTLLLAARHLNEILDQLYRDPTNIAAYKKNPRQLYTDVCSKWNYPINGSADMAASLAYDLHAKPATSKVFTLLISDNANAAAFTKADQDVQTYKILSDNEKG